MPNLIALCGAARHGKTTAAKYLEKVYGYERLFFSKPLKELCIKALLSCAPEFYLVGLTPQELHAYNSYREAFWRNKIYDDRDDFSRWVMQFVGTDIMRAHDKDHWVTLWQDAADRNLRRGYKMVVEDLRFLNEAQAVHRMGGQVWRIVRVDTDSELIESGGAHKSEQEQHQLESDHTIAVPTGAQYIHDAVDNLMLQGR